MRRERALKVVLVVVGLIFCGLVYPLTMFVRQEPALAMMLSVYVVRMLGWRGNRCYEAALDQAERDRIRKALLDYCGQDTLAMVRLLEKLRGTSQR
jgi:hypothetical protein